MYIKLINATAPVSEHGSLHQAQEQWRALQQVPGFVGQVGGWVRNEAVILGFWLNQQSHEAFMASSHDEIAPALASSVRVQVALFEQRGTEKPALSASFLRVERHEVKSSERGRFLQSWARFGSTAVRGAGGLGSMLGHCRQNPERFLVVSFWGNLASHLRYCADYFPTIEHKVGSVPTQVQLVQVQRSWSVIAGEER